MNKKGNLFVIGWIFSLIIFIFIWATWLGKELAFWGTRYIELNSPSAFESFMIANLNLWVFLWLLIITVIVLYGGGGNN